MGALYFLVNAGFLLDLEWRAAPIVGGMGAIMT